MAPSFWLLKPTHYESFRLSIMDRFNLPIHLSSNNKYSPYTPRYEVIYPLTLSNKDCIVYNLRPFVRLSQQFINCSGKYINTILKTAADASYLTCTILQSTTLVMYSISSKLIKLILYYVILLIRYLLDNLSEVSTTIVKTKHVTTLRVSTKKYLIFLYFYIRATFQTNLMFTKSVIVY